jgi:hypothetical protein
MNANEVQMINDSFVALSSLFSIYRCVCLHFGIEFVYGMVTTTILALLRDCFGQMRKW